MLGSRTIVTLGATLALAGCVAAPRSALDRSTVLGSRIERVELTDIPVNGQPVVVTYGGGRCIVEGELIAVTRTTLVVLDNEGALWQIPITSGAKVEIELYSSRSSSLYTATTAGSVSTLSHGYWLLASFPVWLAVGLPLASSESSASHLHTQSANTPQLAAYARFPQGSTMDWTGQARPPAPCQ